MHPINPGPGLWRPVCDGGKSGRMVLRLLPVRPMAPCAECGRPSGRVHSRYWRKAGDLPFTGNRMEVQVEARRFFCDGPGCKRRIFCERFPGILEPYARRTNRALAALLELAHASSAEQAAGIAALYGFRVSPDTLLKLQRRETFPVQSPTVIGIDEFAWKKRMRYGTIIVDLERRRPVDLLPTDSAEEVANWLGRHPWITVMARDRDQVFAQAARTAVPGAVQVADRFHLVQNVTEAFRTFVHSRKWEPSAPPVPDRPDVLSKRPVEDAAPVRGRGRPTLRKALLWEQAHTLKDRGCGTSEIARSLGADWRTVSKYIASPTPPVPAPRRTLLDRYTEYLLMRWAEGEHNASKLCREVRLQGYKGSLTLLRYVVRSWRSGLPPRSVGHPPPPHRLLFQWKENLKKGDEDELDAYLGLNPDIAAAHKLKESFRATLASKGPERLDHWLKEAEASGVAGYARLSKSMREDYLAVTAAVTSPWSNGQTEGQNTRVKLIKRIGYGRAKPDLLRARVLHRAIAAV